MQYLRLRELIFQLKVSICLSQAQGNLYFLLAVNISHVILILNGLNWSLLVHVAVFYVLYLIFMVALAPFIFLDFLSQVALCSRREVSGTGSYSGVDGWQRWLKGARWAPVCELFLLYPYCDRKRIHRGGLFSFSYNWYCCSPSSLAVIFVSLTWMICEF